MIPNTSENAYAAFAPPMTEAQRGHWLVLSALGALAFFLLALAPMLLQAPVAAPGQVGTSVRAEQRASSAVVVVPSAPVEAGAGVGTSARAQLIRERPPVEAGNPVAAAKHSTRALARAR